MKRNDLRYIIGILSTVLLIFSLTACGSGGGGGGGGSTPASQPASSSQTVSGVSATGNPIAGGHVYLKDSVENNIDGDTFTNAAGVYTLDVTGLTPPFFIHISWTDPLSGHTKDLYSVTTAPSGTANINELTNAALVVAIAKAGINVTDPKLIFDNSAFYSDAVEANLAGAINDILNFLAAVLSDPHFNASDVNPLTDYFEADGKGLDKIILEGDIVITPGGKLEFILNGEILGEADLDNLENPDDSINGDEVTSALANVSVSGSGHNSSGATMSLLAGTNWLTYSDPINDMFFESTLISAVTKAGETVTITGEGKVDGTGYIFTATVTNGTPDEMGIVISNGYSAASQDISSGDYNVGSPSGASVSGSGHNSSGATMSLLAGTNWLAYYDPISNTDVESTLISAVTKAGETVTITGEGNADGTGYTFTATVTNGTPDEMGIVISYGYSAASENIVSGDYNVVTP